MVFSGQQIAWGLLKSQNLWSSKEDENATEVFWVATAWFFGVIIGCRSAMFFEFSTKKVQVRILLRNLKFLKLIFRCLHRLLVLEAQQFLSAFLIIQYQFLLEEF